MKRGAPRGCKGGVSYFTYYRGPYIAGCQDARVLYETCGWRCDGRHYNMLRALCARDRRFRARWLDEVEASSEQHDRAETFSSLSYTNAPAPDFSGPEGYVTNEQVFYDANLCEPGDTQHVNEECLKTEKLTTHRVEKRTYRPSLSGDVEEQYANIKISSQPLYVQLETSRRVARTSFSTGVSPSSPAGGRGRSSEENLEQTENDASYEVKWQWIDKCDRVDKKWKDFDDAHCMELEWAYHKQRSGELYQFSHRDGHCIQGKICFRTLTFTSVDLPCKRGIQRVAVARCAWVGNLQDARTQ